MKFDAFMDLCKRRLGFDTWQQVIMLRWILAEESRMLRGADNNKRSDLFSLFGFFAGCTARHSMFPIGHMEKEARSAREPCRLAWVEQCYEKGFLVSALSENTNLKFLKNYLPSRDGILWISKTLEVVGRHRQLCVLLCTIRSDGERCSLALGGNRGPWFVVGRMYKNICMWQTGVAKLLGCIPIGCIGIRCQLVLLWKAARIMFVRRLGTGNRIMMLSCAIDETTVFLRYPQMVSSVTGQEAVFYQGRMPGRGVIEGDVFKEGISLLTPYRREKSINREINQLFTAYPLDVCLPCLCIILSICMYFTVSLRQKLHACRWTWGNDSLAMGRICWFTYLLPV